MAAPVTNATRPQLAPGVRLQLDPTSNQQVLLFPEGILQLNETAEEILARCDGRTFREIVASLSQEYDVDEATLVDDVREIILDFAERKLVQL